MEAIINYITSHDWTAYSFILVVIILFIIPFKGGESALKTILTYFKENKEYEHNLIKRYDSLIEQLQEQLDKQTIQLSVQSQEIHALQREVKELHEENYKLRNIG